MTSTADTYCTLYGSKYRMIPSNNIMITSGRTSTNCRTVVKLAKYCVEGPSTRASGK
jgi:hypothetical protein